MKEYRHICPLDIGFLAADPELSRQVVEAQPREAEKKPGHFIRGAIRLPQAVG